MRGYLICSAKVNQSHLRQVPKNTGLFFTWARLTMIVLDKAPLLKQKMSNKSF